MTPERNIVLLECHNESAYPLVRCHAALVLLTGHVVLGRRKGRGEDMPKSTLRLLLQRAVAAIATQLNRSRFS